MTDSLVSPFKAGFACKCPRCGEGDLFSGFLKVAPVCESCGLDLKFADSGDGRAVFVVFAVAPSVILLAFAVAAPLLPAPWMHLVLSVPTVISLPLLFLRPLEATLSARHCQRGAGEGTSSSARPCRVRSVRASGPS